ncbi:ABC transporter permease [Nakamurella endophytica]|uniref:ABC transporter permease n=1 Tax=Nakamurella endophytica TaxID=1748367 RepID=A0A917T9H9_9ACTN|nr:ABC transporter permease subunit [Nakamurella endophytica]GGM15364.1 ABC transporter permease [Nakamurella endophytica]
MAEMTGTSAPLVQAESPLAPLRPARSGPRLRAARRRRQAAIRWVVVVLVLAFFVTPMVSMVDFTTRLLSGKRSGIAWRKVVDFGQLDPQAKDLLVDGLRTSLILAVLTVVIMVVLLVPTMTWVRLRLPGMTRTIEFICLLPLIIPAIVLVVGYYPIYRFIGQHFSTSSVWLALAYGVLVLPYAYRALDAGLSAIDVKTMSEAARSLGSSWAGVMWRIVVPNIATAIAGAAFLSVALVLGEFTVASLLSKNNLQTSLVLVSSADPRFATAMSLVVLLLAFLLLFVLTFVGNRRRARR